MTVTFVRHLRLSRLFELKMHKDEDERKTEEFLTNQMVSARLLDATF